MFPPSYRYRSDDEDSGRWAAFSFRPGDIVISTRSKSGTTWMQMICALLVFGSPDLPARLVELSPWLDWSGEPIDDVIARLDAQTHRRFVKTHTPLDGIPLDERATYVVVARHPLDMAVSLYHQGDNINRPARARPELHDWLVGWIGVDVDPRAELDSLPGVMMHLSDAWDRRHDPNVVLVHYHDLATDLDGEMRRLARELGVGDDLPDWPRLVEAAGFDAMRARADVLAPDPGGVLKDRAQFFRRGSSGTGVSLLTDSETERYRTRASELAPSNLLSWLHRP